jgi:hypothetical protein
MKRGKGRGAQLAAIALLLLAAAPAGTAAGPAPRAHSDALYNLLAAPHAALVWFPATPHPGEPVLLASVSSDLTSPIVGWAWDLGQGAGFESGGPTRYTSFSTFAPRSVRLRVTDRNGLSDIAAATIHMSTPPASVLQPFPLVRITGIVKRSGVRIRTLAVEAGAGTRSTVTCRGPGCPARSVSLVAPATARGVALVRFRRFQRFLRAGVMLQIRVWKAEKIGSYTRYTIRHGRLPARVDTCLDPSGVRPITCPTS